VRSENSIASDASFPPGTSALYENLQNLDMNDFQYFDMNNFQDFDMNEFLPNFDAHQFNFHVQPSGSELPILPIPPVQSPVRPASPGPEAPPARAAKRGRQEVDEANIIHGGGRRDKKQSRRALGLGHDD
jgi:hypothetical protein